MAETIWAEILKECDLHWQPSISEAAPIGTIVANVIAPSLKRPIFVIIFPSSIGWYIEINNRELSGTKDGILYESYAPSVSEAKDKVLVYFNTHQISFTINKGG